MNSSQSCSSRDCYQHKHPFHVESQKLKHPEQPFVGIGKLRDADDELRKLQRQVKDLEQGNEFLKKQVPFLPSVSAHSWKILAPADSDCEIPSSRCDDGAVFSWHCEQ